MGNTITKCERPFCDNLATKAVTVGKTKFVRRYCDDCAKETVSWHSGQFEMTVTDLPDQALPVDYPRGSSKLFKS